MIFVFLVADCQGSRICDPKKGLEMLCKGERKKRPPPSKIVKISDIRSFWPALFLFCWLCVRFSLKSLDRFCCGLLFFCLHVHLSTRHPIFYTLQTTPVISPLT